MSGDDRLGRIDADALGPARGQAHRAGQLIAAAGETYLPPVPDTSHTNMRWLRSRAAFAGGLVPGARPFRLALRVADLDLLLLDDQDEVQQAQALTGMTADESNELVSDWVRSWTHGALDRKLTHPGYDLPAHPIADGETFSTDVAGLAELAHWFDHADAALQKIASDHPGEATPVRCWPHHFDIALLLEIERNAEGAATRSVGVGLSPGDEAYSEPYWYVNHWPGAHSPELGALVGGGEWHTEGWIGCILRGTVITTDATAAEQAARVEAFLRNAVDSNRSLAGG